MNVSYLPYSATGYFSDIILKYLAQDSSLEPFYHRFPSLENFGEQLKERSDFTAEKRELLHREITHQYRNLPLGDTVFRNINSLLQPNTFTVTTGHQICLFTGPLYFIYKIVTAIRTCQELQKQYPQHHFVPVYWMATEDHDFAEVNHFRLFGTTYTWETDQKGAVGRFSTETLKSLFAELPEHYAPFEQAYLEHENLADATRAVVHHLFKEFGVVCLDADRPELKSAFSPVLERELFEGIGWREVLSTNETLAAITKPQVTPREINLFYLEDGLRERIVKNEDHWNVLNTSFSWNETELRVLLETNPERFSPNVLLRPLYQETLLPNLAYIGGGAEVAYWFQLKGLFDAAGISFPILMLRNSALYIPPQQARKLERMKLETEDLFLGEKELRQLALSKAGVDTISLAAQQKEIDQLFEQITATAGQIDFTLKATVAAEAQRVRKRMTELEKRLSKAAEGKHNALLEQLVAVMQKLFPNNGLQERQDNILNFLLPNPNVISELVEEFHPLDSQFTILEESPVSE